MLWKDDLDAFAEELEVSLLFHIVTVIQQDLFNLIKINGPNFGKSWTKPELSLVFVILINVKVEFSPGLK